MIANDTETAANRRIAFLPDCRFVHSIVKETLLPKGQQRIGTLVNSRSIGQMQHTWTLVKFTGALLGESKKAAGERPH